MNNEAYIRKLNDYLRISGIVTILFGFWLIFKAVFIRLSSTETIVSFLNIDVDYEDDAEAFLFIFYLVVLFFGLLIRFIIGKGAIRESRTESVYLDKKSHYFYVVLAIITLIYAVPSNILMLISILNLPMLMARIAYLIIDFSSVISIFTILVCLYKKKKLTHI